MERSSKGVELSPKAGRAMTDAHYAAELIHDTYPVRAGRNAKAAIGEAFRALQRRERQLPQDVLRDRPRQWTERRVRALWHGEARRVDHYEIQDLTAVAVEEARRERQYLEARQERLAALIAAVDQGEVGPATNGERWQLRGVDLPGVGFTEADERASQEHGWGR